MWSRRHRRTAIVGSIDGPAASRRLHLSARRRAACAQRLGHPCVARGVGIRPILRPSFRERSMIENLASLALAVAASVVAAGAHAQDASPLLESMAGTWDVQQRMWPGP